MKITGQDPAKTAELTLGKAKAKETPPAPAGAKREPKRAAQLPATSSLTTTRAREAIRKEPDVRAEKVAEVKERIRSGKYRVDADKLAEKMINQSLREDIEKP
jgi:negative regulator of flagellin synthesis FlgM